MEESMPFKILIFPTMNGSDFGGDTGGDHDGDWGDGDADGAR